MTPLAQKIANDLTEPARKRRFQDRAGIGGRILDAHCFDVTAVLPAMDDLAADLVRRSRVPGRLAFLPAPATWIEWRDAHGRVGFLLEEAFCGDAEAPPAAGLAWAIADEEGRFGSGRDHGLLLWDSATLNVLRVSSEHPLSDTLCSAISARIYAALAMINTPRIIGRRQHMPHAGLQRKIAASRGMPGKYPLHAWHEIVLEVTPPCVDSGEPREARLTGGKALHFCRAHLRIRLGRLELVSAHWRGDPALGMKQTRYRLEMPRAA